MDFPPKKMLVAGDRLLIAPEEGEERTKIGLYLPATAIDAQQVQEGLIVATGPGDPLPDPSVFDDEPWRVAEKTPRFRPMQARVGDHAIFFRKAAVEIRFEEKRYLVVPQAAVLVLIRDEMPL
jgi:co-chaperonin GroES (HSP10)